MRKPQSQKVSQSWTKITWFSAKFEFRFESFKSKFTLILSVSKLMTGCSKNNRENYPRKCFWTKEKETRVKFNPRSSANQLSNNWALVHLLVLPMILEILFSLICLGAVILTLAFFSQRKLWPLSLKIALLLCKGVLSYLHLMWRVFLLGCVPYSLCCRRGLSYSPHVTARNVSLLSDSQY